MTVLERGETWLRKYKCLQMVPLCIFSNPFKQCGAFVYFLDVCLHAVFSVPRAVHCGARGPSSAEA